MIPVAIAPAHSFKHAEAHCIAFDLDVVVRGVAVAVADSVACGCARADAFAFVEFEPDEFDIGGLEMC